MVESGGGEDEGWDEDGVRIRNCSLLYKEELKLESDVYNIFLQKSVLVVKLINSVIR